MKKMWKLLLNRITIALIFALLQIALFIWMIYYLSSFWQWNLIFITISVAILLFLLSREDNPTYTIAWIIPIILFPVVGGAFYLLYRRRNIKPSDRDRHLELERNRNYFLKAMEEPLTTKEANYLKNMGWPSYKNTATTYLPSGEAMLTQVLKDIYQARHFILMEFFIIKPSHMWTKISDALKQKATDGVEVRVVVDDFGGRALTLSMQKELRDFGIKIYRFNPLKIRLNFANNYRSHRKVVVIDNKFGYVMGNNIGDEYINLTRPLGHWVDTGTRIEGEAVWSLTLMALDTISFIANETMDYHRYYYEYSTKQSKGMIIPFGDTPLDKEEVTKNVYMSLIYSAKHSIRITTPYLIIDPEFKHALRLAAKSGVEVAIIIPAIPDKSIVYMVTKSHLPILMKDGINIYTYTPGFMHAKMMIVDETRAMIGSANLDYRSLYLHFENSIYLHDTACIPTMSEHFETLREASYLLKERDQAPMHIRIIQLILRLFASMM